MIFRPRIFISSTLAENLSIRKELEEFYRSIGAEPMLYETNLTPSVIPTSYRNDILDADFIIFIIKNQYGTPTVDTGLSGTHEEFRIASSINIPKHIYIKKAGQESENQPLKNDIESQQISYFYFENDDELFSRIKETTFTIAKEIMLRKVEDMILPKQSVQKICTNYDYSQAVEIIKIVKMMQSFSNNQGFDLITSTLFSAFIGPLYYRVQHESRLFNDKMLESMLIDMLKEYEDFTNIHGVSYTTIPGTERSFQVPILGKVLIIRCQGNSQSHATYKQCSDKIDSFFNAFNAFSKYVQEMRIEIDSQIF